MFGRRHLLRFLALLCAMTLASAAPAAAQESAEGGDPAPESQPDTPPDAPPSGAEDGDGPSTDESGGTTEPGDDEGEEDEEEPEPPPPPQVSIQSLPTGPVVGTDEELESALFAVDHLDTWYVTTSTAPELTLVQVNEQGEARQDLLETIDELIDAREKIAALMKASLDSSTVRRGLEEDRVALWAQHDGLQDDRAAVIERRTGLEADLAFIEAGIEAAAVGLYLNDQAGGLMADNVGAFNDRQELIVRVDASLDDLLAQRDALELAIAEANAEISALDEAIRLVKDEIAANEDRIRAVSETIRLIGEQITELSVTRTLLEGGLPDQITATQTERLEATVSGLPISLVTLDAYVSAARDVPTYDPTCAIRWEMLAGIAEIESNHARFGGAVVEADGAIVGEILGPVLDGTLENTAVIVDSDGGAMDGNAQYDRAVGPFQFLPSTWSGYGLDADGDGIADPHDLYDAALSAAGYLCASSNMVLDTDIERSVLSYNNSRHYLHNVTAVAHRFIRTYGIPEADFDPETIEADEGWRIRFELASDWDLGAGGPE